MNNMTPPKKKQKISHNNSKWVTGIGSELTVIPQCDGNIFLFGRDLKKKGWEYCALTWEEVYTRVMQGWETRKYCNIYQHRNGNNAGALSQYNELENFVNHLRCSQYIYIYTS